MKIDNDKYYTDPKISKYCIDKTFEIIGKENINSIIEPSAGNGSFSNQLDCIAYDIIPDADNIIKQDFLKLEINYEKDRLIIGNPPFGTKMNLAQKFFKKAVSLGDYIAFILPISQLNNSNTLFEFDLIYSEDLGITNFSDRELHCVFNIYKRPENGLHNKPSNILEDIKIMRESTKGYSDFEFDLRMCYWGNGSAGKILSNSDRKYAGEYKIKIYNEKLKEEIIKVLSNAEWKKELNYIAMLRIKQFDVINILKKYIPQIK